MQSPQQSLFSLNKESIEDMLLRKLRRKYIENNPVFYAPRDEGQNLTDAVRAKRS